MNAISSHPDRQLHAYSSNSAMAQNTVLTPTGISERILKSIPPDLSSCGLNSYDNYVQDI